MKKTFVLRQPEKRKKKPFSVLARNHKSTAASGKQAGIAVSQQIMWMKVKLALRQNRIYLTVRWHQKWEKN